MLNILFCENSVSFSWAVWLNDGFNRCLTRSVSSISIFLFMIIFGSIQLLIFKSRAFERDSRLQPRANFWFRLQLFAHFAQIGFNFVWFFLLIFGFSGRPLSIDLLISCLSLLICWSICFTLLLYERKYDIPSRTLRKNGHGVVLLIFYVLNLQCENLAIVSFNSPTWFWRLKSSSDYLDLNGFILNYFTLVLLLILGFLAPGLPTVQQRYDLAYERLNEAGDNQDRSQDSTFSNLWRKLKTLLPYLWPKGSIGLQCCVIVSVLLLVLGRFVNVYIPIFHKWIVDSLSQGGIGHLVYRWDLILTYVILLLSQGGAMSGGMISVVRGFLWIKVQQYTTREIQVHLYSHLHGLSLRWHLSRKTGEVLRVMDRGTNSINQLLSYLVFNILPTIIDIIVAIIYFTTCFNGWFGLIVLITMTLYLTATVLITEWRTKFRRNMNRLDNAAEAIAVDALLNFETVKYYNAENYEVNRYRNALLQYQAAEWLSMSSMSILNFTQNIIITGGLLTGSLLCAWFVVEQYKEFTVGSYVLFASYIMQLYQPLNWLGTYYRVIQQSFVDMENMFDLLKESQEVKDIDNATSLKVQHGGRIEFKSVNFRYNPDRPILKNINFVVEAGRSVAFVGPSGSGKSTLIRLLFRFYDIDSGCIEIDGSDIAKVKQKSLRKCIGVVPQDTVLFNETIKYNIGYGKVGGASELEIFDAARAAEIHDKIQSFSEGYETMVGERGLKLSGGEKQRVAIARTILKSPQVVLLDEATSALDTQTERLIQASLDEICVGKTTIIVAHRLSTIIHVDEILVLKDGEIIERGSHTNLLEQNGFYAEMWRQQSEQTMMGIASSSNIVNTENGEEISAVENGISNDIVV